jgi:AmmeMemoRadiSam system protein A
MTRTVSAEDQLLLLRCAREAIGSRLSHRTPVYPPAPASAEVECGAFVTLKADGELRGCIGHVTACMALADAVKSAAVSAAFSDPRFPPITPEEWPQVRIEISVLSPFEPVDNPSRVVIGEHGVMIRAGYRSGLLLPQVAAEQGWDRETFLAHACRKAGLPPDAWRSPATTIEVFTATVFHEQE